MIKTIPKKKKCKKAKWLPKEFLQIAEKTLERKRRKGKIYSHLNAEFQRTVRRDKKDLSEKCQEIEGNNRMGKTRDLFKKIRGNKGTFHAKFHAQHFMHSKGQNGKDLQKQKRWQEYTEMYIHRAVQKRS